MIYLINRWGEIQPYASGDESRLEALDLGCLFCRSRVYELDDQPTFLQEGLAPWQASLFVGEAQSIPWALDRLSRRAQSARLMALPLRWWCDPGVDGTVHVRVVGILDKQARSVL